VTVPLCAPSPLDSPSQSAQMASNDVASILSWPWHKEYYKDGAHKSDQEYVPNR